MLVRTGSETILLAIAGAVTVVTTGGDIIVPIQNGRLFESRATGILAPSGVIRLSPAPFSGAFLQKGTLHFVCSQLTG